MSEDINVQDINSSGNWIIEGTYRESQKILYEYADKIIFLDTPLYIRKFRIISRFIKQKLGIEKSNYKPTLEMLKYMFKWTKDFENQRPMHEERLIQYKDKLIWVKSAKEITHKAKKPLL